MIIPKDFLEELVTEILSRLPVRSLLRFKCVCKSWCDRISAKDFAFLHLTNYKPSDLVLAGIDLHIYGAAGLQVLSQHLSIINVSLPTRGSAQGAAPLQYACRSRIVNHPLPQHHDFDKRWGLITEVCGPCNGILCLYSEVEESILLWNPQIQDFKFIPQSNLPRHEAIQGERSHFRYTVGFGFDSETKDYKILQIVRYKQQQQLEVYSLATNSWRILDASPVDSFCVSRLFTAHRKIGWLGRRTIFLFDVSDETLDMIIPPVSLEGETDHSRAKYSHVFPFRESIAVVISTVTKVQSTCEYCEIWMLNDFNCAQSRSWSKLWTIQLESLYQPLGLCGNSYLIFRENRDSFNLKLYDLLNHDVVDVGASMVRPYVYKESLISISN